MCPDMCKRIYPSRTVAAGNQARCPDGSGVLAVPEEEAKNIWTGATSVRTTRTSGAEDNVVLCGLEG